MQFLINPNVVYVLIVVAVMLFLLSAAGQKSRVPMIVMGICLLAAGYELVWLKGNLWALLIVGLSPLPLLIAIQQTRPPLPLLLVTVLMLTVGAAFLFTDAHGHPTVNYALAGLVAVLCGDIIWIGVGRRQNAEVRRLDSGPDSVVGLVGEARTDIENHAAGFVEVEGDRWMARSHDLIPSGSMVRIVRRDGFVLTVRKENGEAKEER
jgi:membrane-bound ClpP family serine protease